MSLRGSLTLECDRKGCQAELVLGDLDFQTDVRRGVLFLESPADEWHEDEDGQFWCPQCLSEIQEVAK